MNATTPAGRCESCGGPAHPEAPYCAECIDYMESMPPITIGGSRRGIHWMTPEPVVLPKDRER
ncbi:hypothetical protein ACPA54_15195 [Uniformispora flossi]|uniref:hypothetical protein n=1 Tax=Uniformispora flossi TaxID=3390723 RepID=UPI003C3060E6